jgi:hypothetical protein
MTVYHLYKDASRSRSVVGMAFPGECAWI